MGLTVGVGLNFFVKYLIFLIEKYEDLFLIFESFFLNSFIRLRELIKQHQGWKLLFSGCWSYFLFFYFIFSIFVSQNLVVWVSPGKTMQNHLDILDPKRVKFDQKSPFGVSGGRPGGRPAVAGGRRRSPAVGAGRRRSAPTPPSVPGPGCTSRMCCNFCCLANQCCWQNKLRYTQGKIC